ncbi:MAG: Na+/H+ antiporter subunit G [Marinomonas sp.]|jgi:multicomponent K+:H+ antiporter subunit G|uniref:Multisubunit potassium/proton antiporter PhaG subunit n=1 Tax=Marinomonas communis TaxID=28254 RepID=A0A4R6X0T3_9GAMM|nr:Na+/H+ antiporter subunit G [Marinomonas communis]MAF15041.1 Na+/H+ antiporter subunit G [Marinomonas sp.]MEC8081337.1 Na+/H+ antiporter subunit G [Pseudomonadota bacterium]MCC4275835.1 Na+/H+ antiporter subunit G [Marinomonas communis]RUM48441.1 MAG: Na+/H+ antiporter subunit G [Marinomonas sp.]TDR05968.1 multisubunit potassium/proton antiporter PhaG subunit [Marinomonas communis]|tara:strand:- start:185 stop:562 length:378 start_codon:yes stop_codon:yes gene_type:complete
MSFYVELVISILLVVGGVFLLIGSIGLARLPDIFTRLHGPTKATTLGITGVLLASLVYQSINQGSFSVSELLITLFLLITAPVAANMIAKTALHRENPAIPRTSGQSLLTKIRNRESALETTDKD